MATLSELARAHSDLDEVRIVHLQNLVSVWGLLADLSFADLVLYARDSRRANGPLVLLGHIRPTTGTTLYRADLVGQVFEPRRRPLIVEAFEAEQAAPREQVVWPPQPLLFDFPRLNLDIPASHGLL